MEQGIRIRTVIFLWILAINISGLYAQSCLPDGVTFSSQEQIDNFQLNYPNCSEIEGYVVIYGDDIQNLQGLNVLTSIGGFLELYDCDELENLAGLENLTSIGSHLIIDAGHGIINLDGLNNLNSIGGGLKIFGHNWLEEITALSNLSNIGEWIEISWNYSLTSLSGLDLAEFSSLTRLDIFYNQSLSDCSIQNICGFLSNPSCEVNIYSNAGGCNNPSEIADECGFVIPCLQYGNYYLTTKEEVDSFYVNYPNCFDLNGNISIWAEGITNLEPLHGLHSVEGNMTVAHCTSLIDFTGLNSLVSIGGMFCVGHWEGNGNYLLQNFNGLDSLNFVGGTIRMVYNASLTSLSGLGSLQSVGGLEIFGHDSLMNLNGIDNLDSIHGLGLSLRGNNGLVSLSGLDSVIYIASRIDIRYNENLENLEGIENVSPNGLDFLFIKNNDNLSECDVEVICEYLIDSTSFTDIHDNASGCNSRQEVEAACGIVAISEMKLQGDISIYPNPFSTSTTIEYELKEPSHVQLTIYNAIGEVVYRTEDRMMLKGIHTVTWSPSLLPPGMYYAVLRSEEGVEVVKMVKQ